MAEYSRKYLPMQTRHSPQTATFNVNVAAPTDPIVSLSGSDLGDPDVDQQVTCQVQASVDHLPYNF